MRRISRREVIAGTLAPALASCSRSRMAQRRNGSTVTIWYEGDPETTFSPVEDQPAKFLVFMPLVVWSRNGELEGRLAKNWEHSRDFRSWTIRLREGVRWHDGLPVTAHDMKFTLDLLQLPDTQQFSPGSYTVTVLDNQTYTINYDRQDLATQGPLNDSIVCWPKHALDNLDPTQIAAWDFWSHPIGCGPYRHARTVPQTMMELEANPEYYRGRPNIERVILKFAGWKPASAMPELLRGSVDAAVCWGPDIISARRNRKLRAYQQPGMGFNALWWNTRGTLFQDAAIRRALTLAINSRELIRFRDLSDETPVADFLYTKRQLARRDFAKPHPYDPRTANQLLDAAGWSARNREGLRVRGGKPFRFTLLIAGNGDIVGPAVYVQDQLKRVGVGMDISFNAAMGQRISAGKFDAAQMWFDGSADLEKHLRARAGYHDEAFFEMLRKTQTTFDPDEQDRAYRELTVLFQASLPVTLLFPHLSSTIASKRIVGLDDSPYRADLTQCMDELWLADEVA